MHKQIVKGYIIFIRIKTFVEEKSYFSLIKINYNNNLTEKY